MYITSTSTCKLHVYVTAKRVVLKRSHRKSKFFCNHVGKESFINLKYMKANVFRWTSSVQHFIRHMVALKQARICIHVAFRCLFDGQKGGLTYLKLIKDTILTLESHHIMKQTAKFFKRIAKNKLSNAHV